jgi:predicted metal-binding protein
MFYWIGHMEIYGVNFMKDKLSFADVLILLVALGLFIGTFFIPPKYNLFNYLKATRLESYNQKYKEVFITCIYCEGTGERNEDVNLIWRDAKMALWLNNHLMNDKCKECDNKNDKYCKKVNEQYDILSKEYDIIGPKFEPTSCSECMGMGQFSRMNKDGSYVTQAEYEEKEKKDK